MAAPQLALPGIRPGEPPKQRGARCARDVDAGPGTCGHWWHSCPEKVAGCYNREIRAIADRHGVREREPVTPAMQADIDAMHDRRRGERST
jgi:hypothetical protein